MSRFFIKYIFIIITFIQDAACSTFISSRYLFQGLLPTHFVLQVYTPKNIQHHECDIISKSNTVPLIVTYSPTVCCSGSKAHNSLIFSFCMNKDLILFQVNMFISYIYISTSQLNISRSKSPQMLCFINIFIHHNS